MKVSSSETQAWVLPDMQPPDQRGRVCSPPLQDLEQLAGSRLAEGGDHPLAGVVQLTKASSRTMPPAWRIWSMISVMPAARRFRHTVMPSTERLPRGGNIFPRLHGTWSSS